MAIDNDGNIVVVNMGDTGVLTFSPDGSLFAVCGRSFDELASVFDGVEQLMQLE